MARKRLDVESALASLAMFRVCSHAELEPIVRDTRVVRARRGEMLFSKGDPCAGFHVIMYGQVKLSLSTAQGGEKVLQIYGPGQTFGEAVMFLERPYPVHAQALSEALLLHVSRKSVFDAIETNHDFGRHMLGGLSMRLHELVGDVEALSMRSAAQRLVGYLLNLCEAAPGAPPRATLPTAKHLIASRLNLTPETLSRILHTLVQDEVIRVEGRSVTICDLERLRAFG